MIRERYIPRAHTLAELAANLQERRLLRGWSQYRLAELAGISRATVRNIELGNHAPHPDTVARLAQALGISVSRLWEKF